jgi:hypothetical protein
MLCQRVVQLLFLPAIWHCADALPPLDNPSCTICHFSSGDRSTRGFLHMLPPVWEVREVSRYNGEHYKSLLRSSLGKSCPQIEPFAMVK